MPHRIARSYNGNNEKENAFTAHAYHCVHIWYIEPYASEEVAGGIHHENWVFKKTEVQHLVQDFSLLGVSLDTADIRLGLGI